jgi:hypothetical protein
MKIIRKIFLIAISIILINSCKKDDPTPVTVTVDLSQAKLTDFKLEELNYADIDISHPVITNGVETQRGSITVYVPAGTPLNLTPKVENFVSNNFTVQPALGVINNFSLGSVVYTIVSNRDPQKKVHYDVEIIAGQAPNPNAKVTGFRFEKSRNAQLTDDIIESKIVEGVGTLGKIFIFVPLGTNYTTLNATIDFEGATLLYSQDPLSNPATTGQPYPAIGKQINFRYPNFFFLVVKNQEQVAQYQVIVDVRQPLKINVGAVTTPNVQKGNIDEYLVTQIENQGNSPLSLRQISHQDQFPTGTSAVRGVAAFPSGGLMPGTKSNVFANVNASVFGAGQYATTALFKPALQYHIEANEFLEPASLRINAEIVE